MAYSSAGKQTYASLSDLPQYSSIGAGDKILIYNESAEGPATIDFSDIIIDLDQCSFRTTVSEMIDLASNIQVFVSTTAEDIEKLQNNVTNIERTINNELRSRIKVLEFLVAVLIGANSKWTSEAGLEILYNRFVKDGLSAGAISADLTDASDTEDKQYARGWYRAVVGAIADYISHYDGNASLENILLQNKFLYRYIESTAAAKSGANSITSLSQTMSDAYQNVINKMNP
jgi:hypothetical protein